MALGTTNPGGHGRCLPLPPLIMCRYWSSSKYFYQPTRHKVCSPPGRSRLTTLIPCRGSSSLDMKVTPVLFAMDVGIRGTSRPAATTRGFHRSMNEIKIALRDIETKGMTILMVIRISPLTGANVTMARRSVQHPTPRDTT